MSKGRVAQTLICQLARGSAVRSVDRFSRRSSLPESSSTGTRLPFDARLSPGLVSVPDADPNDNKATPRPPSPVCRALVKSPSELTRPAAAQPTKGGPRRPRRKGALARHVEPSLDHAAQGVQERLPVCRRRAVFGAERRRSVGLSAEERREKGERRRTLRPLGPLPVRRVLPRGRTGDWSPPRRRSVPEAAPRMRAPLPRERESRVWAGAGGCSRCGETPARDVSKGQTQSDACTRAGDRRGAP